MSQQHRRPVASESGYHIPAELKDYDIWVVWVPEWDKTARAPWQEGHMYPCEWSVSKPLDPRRSYDKASAAASIPIEQIHDNWPFPDDKPLPQTVKPAVLLPPRHHPSDVAFVDFDDVREPDTGEVSPEVWELVQKLDSYTEISRSGTGLHVYVRGELPPGKGKFITDLKTEGQIEVYDHGRMTGGTWRHVANTPPDRVREAQDTLDEIYTTYESDDILEPPPEPEPRDSVDALGTLSDTDRSPYYDSLSLKDVADCGPFRRYRTDIENPARDDWQGPHPAHGGTSSQDRDSANFNVDDGQWHCFAHGDGGGSLELIAILEGVVRCGSSDKIHRDRELMLETCLHARDSYGMDADADPPYAALQGLADVIGFEYDDPEEGILGRLTHKLTRKIYDEMSVDDL